MKRLFLPFLLLMSFCLQAIPTVGVIGDSISVPYPVSTHRGYLFLLERQFYYRGTPIRFLNYSLGGSTTETGPVRVKEMLTSDPIDVLIIMLGVNDAALRTPATTVKEHLKEMIKLAQDQHVKVVIGSVDIIEMPWRTHPLGYLSTFKDLYLELSNEYPSVIVFPFLSAQLTSNPEYHVGDSVHPNEKGQQVIANHLFSILDSLLFKYYHTQDLKTENETHELVIDK